MANIRMEGFGYDWTNYSMYSALRAVGSSPLERLLASCVPTNSCVAEFKKMHLPGFMEVTNLQSIGKGFGGFEAHQFCKIFQP